MLQLWWCWPHIAKLPQPVSQRPESEPRSTQREGASATPPTIGAEKPGKRLTSSVGHNAEEGLPEVATRTRMRTNAVLLTSFPSNITLELDSCAELDIIDYDFAQKHDLRRVAMKAPRLRYLDGVAHENFGVFEVPVQVTDSRGCIRSLTIYCTAVHKDYSQGKSPILLGIPTLSKEAILLFPRKNR